MVNACPVKGKTAANYALFHIKSCESDDKNSIHSDPTKFSPLLDSNHWVDWAIKYTASDSSSGLIEVWRGNTGSKCQKLFSWQGTNQGCNNPNGYFKLGIYRHTPSVTATKWV